MKTRHTPQGLQRDQHAQTQRALIDYENEYDSFVQTSTDWVICALLEATMLHKAGKG